MSDLRDRLAGILLDRLADFHTGDLFMATQLAEAVLAMPGIAITEGLRQERANLCGDDEYAPLHVRWVSEWERVGPKGAHSCPHAAVEQEQK